MRRNLIPLIFILAAGCASTPPPQVHFSGTTTRFPANGFITQRAVFSARGRQLPLNGYLALSESGGKRLVVTENFGHVMADVLVKPDGKIYVMQSSRLFSPKYIRMGVAADLQCVFGGANNQACPVERVGANHFLVRRHAYSLDLRIVDVKSGAQPAGLFDESKAEAE